MTGWNADDTSESGGTGAAGRVSRGKLAPRQIATNVASIEGVPRELLGGVDREWALAWARKGYDVYACRDEDGMWYLWLATRCVELGSASTDGARRLEMRQRH